MRHLLAAALKEAKKYGVTLTLSQLLLEARSRVSDQYQSKLYHKVVSQIQIYITRLRVPGKKNFHPHALKRKEQI